MAISHTYATLSAALIAFAQDEGTDFSDQIDTLIGMGEERVLRDLNLTIFDTTSEETLSADSTLLTKPTGALFFRALNVKNASDAWQGIEPRSNEYLTDYYPSTAASASETAYAKYWAEYSATQLRLVPMSDTDQIIQCAYMVKPDQLSSSNTSTWLSTNVGDLLFYACILSAMQYNIADERLEMWNGEYQKALVAASLQFQHLRAAVYSPVKSASAKVN